MGWTDSLVNVKSFSALLLMLLLCVRSYLKSVLQYKFLIFDTYHPDTVYLREPECEDPWPFFEPNVGPGNNSLGNTDLMY